MANTLPVIIKRASKNSYQVRRHESGCYQVYARRYAPNVRPSYTAWNIAAALQAAKKGN